MDLPPAARDALASLGAPTTVGAAASRPSGDRLSPPPSRTASVPLDYSFAADAPYAPGSAGYILTRGAVTFSGPPFDTCDMLPTGAAYPDNFAAAIWRVDDLSEPAGGLVLTLGLTLGDVGVAAYNWVAGAHGRWEPLHYGPAAGNLDLDLNVVPGANWANASGDMAICVFCLHPHQLAVQQLEVEGGGNAWPLADLDALPSSGTVPLDVTLDASASIDPDGNIVDYSFDPDGSGFVSNGLDSTFDFQYTAPGIYSATVEVTDDDGATAQFFAQVTVNPAGVYDEIEDNDDEGSAQTLSFDFSNFSGNIGPGGPHDGDSTDYYTFAAQDDDNVHFSLSSSTTGLSLSLIDSDGDVLDSATGPTNLSVSHFFEGWEIAPFFLVVESPLGSESDYFLAGELRLFNEVEDNDDDTVADLLEDLEQTGVLNTWSGSFGDGGSNYDGDTIDFSAFSKNGNSDYDPGDEINLTLTYDGATADMQLTLYDTFGNTLASSSTGSGIEDLNYTVASGVQCPFFVEITEITGNPPGFSDYNLSGTAGPP